MRVDVKLSCASVRIRLIAWLVCSILVASATGVVWQFFQPIRTPLRAGMTLDEVRSAFTADTAHSYSFYSDPGCCSRPIFQWGEVFSYHTWIVYSFDAQSGLDSVQGHHATTIELPIIGFHDYEFSMRDIALPK